MTAKFDSLSSEENQSTYSEPLQSVIDALKKIRFGAIQLTVHEGKLVQVDVTERKRFAN